MLQQTTQLQGGWAQGRAELQKIPGSLGNKAAGRWGNLDYKAVGRLRETIGYNAAGRTRLQSGRALGKPRLRSGRALRETSATKRPGAGAAMRRPCALTFHKAWEHSYDAAGRSHSALGVHRPAEN